MGEDELADPSLTRQPAGLRGRQVTVPVGQRRLRGEERGLAQQQIGTRRELDGAVAPAGVHHRREHLARSVRADLLDVDGASVDLERPGALQFADRRSGDAE